MKRISILLLSIVMAFTLAGTASAAVAVKPVGVKVVMDGKLEALSTNLIIKKSKFYVEFRTALNRFGYKGEYQKTTQTIIANTEGIKLKVTVGNDVAYVNDVNVSSKDDVIIYQGKVWLGLRFIASVSKYTVGWNSEQQLITLTYNGATPDYKVAMYNVLQDFAKAQETADSSALLSVMATDTIADIKDLQAQLKNANTKTVFSNNRVESHTDTVATVFVIEETSRIGGGFFPSTKSQVRYTLHKNANGVWKIYNREVLTQEYTDLMGAFEQAVTVPAADKTALGDVYAAQVKAANTTTRTSTIEKLAIVENKDSNHAKLYVSLITETEVSGIKKSTRAYLVNEAEKVDGKWVLSSTSTQLYQEDVK
jgi:ketosteroid isomerase-like protein